MSRGEIFTFSARKHAYKIPGAKLTRYRWMGYEKTNKEILFLNWKY